MYPVIHCQCHAEYQSDYGIMSVALQQYTQLFTASATPNTRVITELRQLRCNSVDRYSLSVPRLRWTMLVPAPTTGSVQGGSNMTGTDFFI